MTGFQGEKGMTGPTGPQGKNRQVHVFNFVGMVAHFTYTLPDSTLWLRCDGQSYSTTEYSELYNAIGYNFGGSGNNFNVPLMDGRFARCTNYNTGQNSLPNPAMFSNNNDTIKSHTHNVSTQPSHNHNFYYNIIDCDKTGDNQQDALTTLTTNTGTVMFTTTVAGNHNHDVLDDPSTSPLETAPFNMVLSAYIRCRL
jgi:microcystin-dependent protein